MRFADIENIWTVDADRLSNADLGRVYYERAKQVVAKVLAKPAEHPLAIRNNKFSRLFLVAKIGCKAAVTTQNPNIRKLLSDTDLSLKTICPISELKGSGPIDSIATPPLRKSKFADVSAVGQIVVTDSTCIINGHAYPGLPTLVWPEGIDETVSDWLRYMVVVNGIALSSAYEYAKILRPFLRFCRRRGRAWQSVDDAFLILWREHLRRAEHVDVPRINTSLTTIFAFYLWAEENRILRFQVGIYSLDGELPALIADISTFAISATPIYTKGRQGRVRKGWTTPLTLSGGKRTSPVRHTPTDEEISRLHDIALDRSHGERDSLIFSWTEEAGPRRAETMQICKAHMPTSDQLANLIERDDTWAIAVKRKGGKTKSFRATPELIIRTLDYIQFKRGEIVSHCQATIVGYREPDEVFLSGTTGMPLHLDSVTSIGRRSFRNAGIERASVHRLRAKFAVRTIESLVDAIFSGDINIGSESSWIETILVKAAEMMGQSSPDSLRPYLTYVLNRRIQMSDAMKGNRLASRVRQLQLQASVLDRRVSQNKNLHTAAMLIKNGSAAKAAAILREIASTLEPETSCPAGVAHDS